MARSSLILVLAWTLLLLPALCTGGWLLHPCDCGSTISCQHESDCGSDPCEIGMTRAESGSENLSEAASSTTCTRAAADDLARTLASRLVEGRPNASPVVELCCLPFPPSDLPLLI